jgi:hypothetical protein
VAIIKCNDCGGYAVSWGGGVFAYCPCSESFIDQERFGGLYSRVGGNAEFIEVICPSTCEYREDDVGNHMNHSENKQIYDKEELRKYLLDTYNYKLPKEY